MDQLPGVIAVDLNTQTSDTWTWAQGETIKARLEAAFLLKAASSSACGVGSTELCLEESLF